MDKVKNCTDFASICSYIELFSEDLAIHVSIPQLISSIVQVDPPNSPTKPDVNTDEATKSLLDTSPESKEKVNSEDVVKCEATIDKSQEDNIVNTSEEDKVVDIPKEDKVRVHKEDENVDTPKEENKDVDIPKEENKDVVTPKQENKDVVTPKQENKDVVTPKQENKDVVTPKEENKDVGIPKEDVTSEKEMKTDNGDATEGDAKESASNGVNHSEEEDELEIFRASMSLLPMTPRLRKSWVLLHVRLLNKIGVRTQEIKWERGLSKFLALYVTNLPIDQYYAFESKGYSGLDVLSRTKLLAYLMEYQFEKNNKFKEKVNSLSIERLRPKPLGVDVFGSIYWLFKDPNHNFLLYQENSDDDSIKLLCETIHQLKRLLHDLKSKQECISGISPESDNQASTKENQDNSNQNSVPPTGIPLPLLGPFYKKFIGESPSTSSAATTENSPRPDTYQNGSEQTCANDNHESVPQTSEPISHEDTSSKNNDETVKGESNHDDLIQDCKSDNNDSLEDHSPSTPTHNQSIMKETSVDPPADESSQINEDCNGVRRSGRQRKQVKLFGAATQFTETKSPSKCKAAAAPKSSPVKAIKQTTANKAKQPASKSKKATGKRSQAKDETSDEDEENVPQTKLKNNLSQKRPSKKPIQPVKPVKNAPSKRKKAKKGKSKLSQPWEGDSSDDSDEPDFDHEFFVEEESEIEDMNLTDNWTDAPESDFDEVVRAGESSDDELLKQRGRNYARQKKRRSLPVKVEETVEVEETPCQICGDSKLPEWLLLCDECDFGFHTMCLRPVLMIIPDGDWFCPRCQHKSLVEKLEEKITELSSVAAKKSTKLGIEERLNFVNISMTNILGDGGEDLSGREEARKVRYYSDAESGDYSDRSQSESGASASSSGSSSGESVERRRPTRQRRDVKYNYDEFDKIIGEAIEGDEKYLNIKKKKEKLQKKEDKDLVEGENEKSDEDSEVEEDEDEEDISDASAPKGKSRGKDMANILGPDWDKSDEDKPKPVGRRNRKKLSNNLSSGESVHDDDDDEEFKLSDGDVDSEEEAEEAKFRSKAKGRYRDSDESWNEDDNMSDESWCYKPPRRETRYSSGRRSSRSKKSSHHKSKQKRRRVDDSDDDYAPRRPRRAAARSSVNYRAIENSSEDEDSDNRRPSKNISRKKKKLSSDDEEYRNSESNSDDEEYLKKRNEENLLKKRKRIIQSSSDDSNPDTNRCSKSQTKRLKEDDDDDEQTEKEVQGNIKKDEPSNNEKLLNDTIAKDDGEEGDDDEEDDDDIPECSDVLPDLNESDLEAAEAMINFVVDDNSNSNLYQPNLP